MKTPADARERIRAIDEQVLALLAERMNAAKAVGRMKREAGQPLRDWDVEREVIDRTESAAARLGLTRAFARSLMQGVIAESRAEQEREQYSSYSGQAETIAVIGGAGRMGGWFADFFANQGHQIRVFDTATTCEFTSLREAIDGAAFAMIATPLETVPDRISALAETGFDGIAFDVASLKGHMAPAIDRARTTGLRYTSIHPMFGSGKRTLSDAVICICDCGDPSATESVRAFFSQTAATLVDLSMARHDEIVSYVLGLSHFVNVAIARALMRSSMPYDTLARIGSTTFHAQMETTATVIREQPELYYAIQKLNAFTPSMYASLRSAIEDISGFVERGEADAFVHMMSAARDWMETR
jgi:chorismate mutase/prephenate dehydrogenase